MTFKTLEDYLWDARERGITEFQASIENAVDLQLEIHFYSTQKEEISLSYRISGNDLSLVDEPVGFEKLDDPQT